MTQLNDWRKHYGISDYQALPEQIDREAMARINFIQKTNNEILRLNNVIDKYRRNEEMMAHTIVDLEDKLDNNQWYMQQPNRTAAWHRFESKVDELRDMLAKHTACNSYYNMLTAIDNKITELLVSTRSIIKEKQ